MKRWNLMLLVMGLAIGCDHGLQQPVAEIVAMPELELAGPREHTARLRQSNWVSKQAETYGQGSCVFASLISHVQWQNRPIWLSTFAANSLVVKPKQVHRQTGRDEGRVRRTGVLVHASCGSRFLDWCDEQRRGCILWWKPYHCCTFRGWIQRGDKQYAVILDNNHTNQPELIEREQFIRLWAGLRWVRPGGDVRPWTQCPLCELRDAMNAPNQSSFPWKPIRALLFLQAGLFGMALGGVMLLGHLQCRQNSQPSTSASTTVLQYPRTARFEDSKQEHDPRLLPVNERARSEVKQGRWIYNPNTGEHVWCNDCGQVVNTPSQPAPIVRPQPSRPTPAPTLPSPAALLPTDKPVNQPVQQQIMLFLCLVIRSVPSWSSGLIPTQRCSHGARRVRFTSSRPITRCTRRWSIVACPCESRVRSVRFRPLCSLRPMVVTSTRRFETSSRRRLKN